MTNQIITIIGIGLPFLGTALGAAAVYFFRKNMGNRLQRGLLGFASGVMIAASVWSLLIPSIEMTEAAGGVAWVPCVAGFLAGVFFLLLLDRWISRMKQSRDRGKKPASPFERSFMLVLAVTLHNLPEGMAVGVAFAGLLQESAVITAAGALALSIGIAVQNFPEGAIISTPLAGNGCPKGKAFLYGVLSGIVEPIGAVLTLLMTAKITAVLPYILSFAAGAMIYVVAEELIPQAQTGGKSCLGTVGVALGFAVMMLLDVALG